MIVQQPQHVSIASQKPRYSGIDLCRGLAAYAVVQVHSGDQTWGLPVEPSAVLFRSLFNFAVPFFLAASFFFLVRKPGEILSRKFWQSRIDRILVPYAIWSLIYAICRVTFFKLNHQTAQKQLLLNDPFSIVFFGGASYHLYFLPLLFTGTALMLVVFLLQKFQVHLRDVIILTIISVLLYVALVASGNDFHIGPESGFDNLVAAIAPNANQNNIIRWLLVQLAWLVQCLPYVLLSVLLNRCLNPGDLLKSFNGLTTLIFGGLFILFNGLKSIMPENGSMPLLVAFSLLMTGISISKHVNASKFSNSLGACSFGIYLIHPLVTNLLKPIIHRIFPVTLTQISMFSILVFCISTFIVSWIAVSLLRRHRLFAKYLF
jgi:peptidoglycan/LPS O-acetylase OafA/YrhL